MTLMWEWLTGSQPCCSKICENLKAQWDRPDLKPQNYKTLSVSSHTEQFIGMNEFGTIVEHNVEFS